MRRWQWSLLLVVFWLVAGANFGCTREHRADTLTVPNLPRPVARERALVTTAGQSTDGLITAKILERLSISYEFRSRVTAEDLTSRFQSLIVTVGAASTGLRAAGLTEEEERVRVVELLREARSRGMAVVVVYLGGANRRGRFTDDLLSLAVPYADYLVAVREGDRDHLISELAETYGVYITLTKDIEGVRMPLGSAFR